MRKQLCRLIAALAFMGAACLACGFAATGLAETFAIEAIGATITLPDEWTVSDWYKTMEENADGKLLVFCASKGYEANAPTLYVMREIQPVDPPHSDDLNRWRQADLEGFLDRLDDHPDVRHVGTLWTSDTLAVHRALDYDGNTTLYDGYLVYGDVQVMFQMISPIPFDDEEYELFQDLMASVAFAEDPSAQANGGAAPTWMRTFQADLEAYGLKGVRYEYIVGNAYESGLSTDIFTLYYGAYEASVYVLGAPNGTVQGLNIYFPCERAYMDEEDMRLFDDLLVITSACALVGGEPEDPLVEIVLQIYYNIMDEMNGAPRADWIRRDGCDYMGTYDADLEEAVLVIRAGELRVY